MLKWKTNFYHLIDLYNMNTLLTTFSTFTREDWIEFDRLKWLAFQPTQEELEEQAKQQEEQKQLVITNKLQAIWITRPEVITKEFVLQLLEIINAKEFVWADLDLWIENQINLYWDLETAFNDLVYSRL
jgi:hypothetical protein